MAAVAGNSPIGDWPHIQSHPGSTGDSSIIENSSDSEVVSMTCLPPKRLVVATRRRLLIFEYEDSFCLKWRTEELDPIAKVSAYGRRHFVILFQNKKLTVCYIRLDKNGEEFLNGMNVSPSPSAYSGAGERLCLTWTHDQKTAVIERFRTLAYRKKEKGTPALLANTRSHLVCVHPDSVVVCETDTLKDLHVIEVEGVTHCAISGTTVCLGLETHELVYWDFEKSVRLQENCGDPISRLVPINGFFLGQADTTHLFCLDPNNASPDIVTIRNINGEVQLLVNQVPADDGTIYLHLACSYTGSSMLYRFDRYTHTLDLQSRTLRGLTGDEQTLFVLRYDDTIVCNAKKQRHQDAEKYELSCSVETA